MFDRDDQKRNVFTTADVVGKLPLASGPDRPDEPRDRHSSGSLFNIGSQALVAYLQPSCPSRRARCRKPFILRNYIQRVFSMSMVSWLKVTAYYGFDVVL
ncbi:hypothetical protein BGY98DRAFT_1046873 [Russula aff. rugulosa BPL654]|nr:hypothetical protein BGY98DRAFT_1046873 [Russula aff. rugulosa BPL654]